MPGLVAYLIALCLLLGGGAGALHWLAAPEPAMIAAKSDPKTKSRSSQRRPAEPATAALSATTSEPDSASAQTASDDIDTTASTASIEPPAPQEPVAPAIVGNTPPAAATPSPDSPTRLAHAEISADGVRPAEVPDVRPSKSAAPRAATASDSADIDARPSRPHRRHAGNRPAKRRLEVMTLRTIEFPDGRRVTRLIPYRDRERLLAFGAD
jgi:hypothetical protein